MVDILAQSCEEFRDRPAFRNFGATLTFGDLDRLSRNFAATLQAKGLKPGERIAVEGLLRLQAGMKVNPQPVTLESLSMPPEEKTQKKPEERGAGE